MRKAFAGIKTCLFWLVLALMSIGLLAGIFFPAAGTHLPFRLYTVLTDSMAPEIPPMSLVLVRQIFPDAPLELEPEQIITFRAERFGRQIIQTHHFSHTEWDAELGQMLYRTHPQGTRELDFYRTTREDILGVYVLSVPRLGKILLFLKSPWGLLFLAEELVIFWANRLFRVRWKKCAAKEKPASAPWPSEYRHLRTPRKIRRTS